MAMIENIKPLVLVEPVVSTTLLLLIIMNELSGQQIITLVIVYGTSVMPLIILAILYAAGKLPRWVAAVYILSFFICAVGWEIWFTFGLWGGAPVNERRPAAMNIAIPQSVNWALNSLADAAAICLVGLLLVWLAYGRRSTPFRGWRWRAFMILLLWFVWQNLCVELFVYQAQLALGYKLSWAPLAPTGPWWNPIIFSVFGRTVQLQTQVPWVLMAPTYYFIVLACYRRLSGVMPEAEPKNNSVDHQQDRA